jgi:hypothetical protein
MLDALLLLHAASTVVSAARIRVNEKRPVGARADRVKSTLHEPSYGAGKGSPGPAGRVA